MNSRFTLWTMKRDSWLVCTLCMWRGSLSLQTWCDVGGICRNSSLNAIRNMSKSLTLTLKVVCELAPLEWNCIFFNAQGAKQVNQVYKEKAAVENGFGTRSGMMSHRETLGEECSTVTQTPPKQAKVHCIHLCNACLGTLQVLCMLNVF